MSAIRNRGFTLVEMLVVIAIMALLLAILLPSLRKAKEATRLIACKTNLNQLSVALFSYLSDSRQRMPYTSTAYTGGTCALLVSTEAYQRDPNGVGLLVHGMYFNASASLYCPGGEIDPRAPNYINDKSKRDDFRKNAVNYVRDYPKYGKDCRMDYETGWWGLAGVFREAQWWPREMAWGQTYENYRRLRSIWIADGLDNDWAGFYAGKDNGIIHAVVWHNNYQMQNVGLVDGSVRDISDPVGTLEQLIAEGPPGNRYVTDKPYNNRPNMGWWDAFSDYFKN